MFKFSVSGTEVTLSLRDSIDPATIAGKTQLIFVVDAKRTDRGVERVGSTVVVINIP